ncbi:WhiB family transcriptional regulator [Actinophytocola sediminis]
MFDLGDRSGTDWIRRGVCAQTDPEAFFPEDGANARAAKAVCRSCPVVAECLRYAVARPALTGVWGATSSLERQQLRRVANRRADVAGEAAA